MARTRSQSREPDPQAPRRAPIARKPQQRKSSLCTQDARHSLDIGDSDILDLYELSTDVRF